MELPVWVWLSFIGFVLALLALDLGVFHRKAHVVSTREAAGWSLFWVMLSLAFAAGVYHFMGAQKGTEFITGYLIEKSLAVDNIFVFVMVFSFFAVPAALQHRVLFWGIIGALVMRGAMIALGAALIAKFHWIIYVFGGFLLLTGARMLLHKNHGETDLNKNPAVKFARRVLRVTDDYDGQKFFTVRNGVRYATPLFLALVFIEFSDLIFAVDSIPAIFAITQDPFIVFTSNVLAILGLRSMYFLLASVVDRFVYLKTGLSVILVFIGAKMMLLDVYKIPTAVSLGVVSAILAASVLFSLWRTARAPILPGGGESLASGD
ncbi:MAG TPA: TerC family protein [Deinococcales bacterium]|nr:TerC family protein [Deinococcales bacterium]